MSTPANAGNTHIKSKAPMAKSEDAYIGQTRQAEFGVVDDSFEENFQAFSMDDVELEAFMNEPVRVRMLSSNTPGEAQFVPVSVDGVVQMFMRNVPIVVRRKYVERLARSKRTNLSQTLDPAKGEGLNQVTRSKAMVYPFQVEQDWNPKGIAWLESVMASA